MSNVICKHHVVFDVNVQCITSEKVEERKNTVSLYMTCDSADYELALEKQ